MNDAMMYAVFFETRMHSFHNRPVGKIIDLSDPDIILAKNDEEAIKMAFNNAEVIEYLKSLRLDRKKPGRKLRVRVKSVVRKGTTDKVILIPKYKGEFKHMA